MEGRCRDRRKVERKEGIDAVVFFPFLSFCPAVLRLSIYVKLAATVGTVQDPERGMSESEDTVQAEMKVDRGERVRGTSVNILEIFPTW